MRAALASILITAMGLPANAADCPLERATYAEPGGWTLAFEKVKPEDELGASNAFSLGIPSGRLRLEGFVSWGNGFTRPIGSLSFGCPQDATDAERESCQHWRGIVYGVTGGVVGLLAHGDEPAHDAVVLANLGQTLNYSLFPSEVGALGETLEDMPWDVFTFAGCTP